MKDVILILPHQLFKEPLTVTKNVILYEDPYFFTRFKFHKKKLILHRASMKAYAQFLKKKKYSVKYIEFKEKINPYLKKYNTVHLYDPIEKELEKKYSKKTKIYDSPNFINSKKELDNYFRGKKHFLLHNFYVQQRKKQKILVDAKGNPKGGKWNFDKENRKKLPSTIKIPKIPKVRQDNFVKEAIVYVEKHFSKNYGSSKSLDYPITHKESEKWFTLFLKQRLKLFGSYQDAIIEKEHYLFHAVITPMLNVGLLSPLRIIKEVETSKVPLNSKEGFIRQILGWREFIRGVYEFVGEKQKKSNFFKHKKKISKTFWQGKTNIAPVDTIIKKALDSGYSHHIERLMVLSNFMLLCEFFPLEVYKWFMEMYIDSYDWVMVPNVFGMGQFADGGMMSSKPYFSSSNYLLKMGDFSKGEWCDIWDGLFWQFVQKHKKMLSKNPRLNMICSSLDKMNKSKKKDIFSKANTFKRKL